MEKGNIDLSRLIKHSESFNRSEGKSPSTLEWYTYVLEFFRNWLEECGLSTALEDIGEYEVREFILYLQERQVNGRPLSSHTVANRVRGLKGFFSWLGTQGYTNGNVLEKLKVPKTDQRLVEVLTPKEVDRLFSAINANSALGARNSAMVALFLDAGLRLSELTNLKEEDVHLDDRYVKVMGKGSKERMLPLGARCHRAMLHYYYHFRPEPLHTGINTFFLTLDGYPLTPRAVRSLVARLSRSAEVPRLHPHLFRHTYATHFLINGGDLLLLKQNLGHSSLTMVEHYRHVASQIAAVTSRGFSPLDHMHAPSLRRHKRKDGSPTGQTYPNAGRPRGQDLARRSGVRQK